MNIRLQLHQVSDISNSRKAYIVYYTLRQNINALMYRYSRQHMTMKLPEWDFSTMYSGPNDPTISTTVTQALTLAKEFQQKKKGKIATMTAEQMKTALQEVEQILEMVMPVGMYSRLLLAKDTQKTEYQQLVAEIQEKDTQIQNKLIFFELEINDLPDDAFNNLVADEELQNYEHYLKDLRKYKPYQLSESEEQMIQLKNQYGKNAFQKLYGELTSSWQFEIEVDGEVKKMGGAQLRSLRMHPNPEIRRKAMKLFFAKYEENSLVIVNIFNSLFKDYYLENQKRGYPTPITRRNMSNEIDDQIVKTLGEITDASYPNIVHRYYNLKKKIIGLDKLTLADIYAPLPTVNKKYSWKEATELVLAAFGSFDDEFKQIVQRMMNEHRIDAPPTVGKRGGAFCAGSTPNDYPWVFLNYIGNINDVSTLAHELGHAIHSVLGMIQTPLNFGLSLVTAEIASVFAEMLLTDYMLNNTKMTKEEKIAFISQTIESNIATSHRQNMFYNFESIAHELIKEKLITSDEFCEIYKSELEKMFGDSVEIPDEYKWEWSVIPHFISVYHYVYAYNMSNLLVLGLYQLYLERGEKFVPQFKKLLAVRKSLTPVEMLAEIGIDISDREFWKKGLKYLEGMINQLEELLS